MNTIKYAMGVFTCVFVLVFFAAAVNGSVADSPWPLFQHDTFNNGLTTNPGPDYEDLAINFQEYVDAGASSPVIDQDGTVYVGGKDGCLYSVSPDGAVDCLYMTDGPIESSPALSADGTIYVASGDGYLYAISVNGSCLWRVQLDASIFTSPVIGPNDSIYVGTSSQEDQTGFLYAIGPDGQEQWKYRVGVTDFSSPAIDAFGTIYIGSTNGTLNALSSDGAFLWSYDIGLPIITAPVIGPDGSIYCSALTSLVALDSSGILKWEYTPEVSMLGAIVPSSFVASPVINSDGTLYIGGVLGDVHCLLDKDERAHIEWSMMLKDVTLADPVPLSISSSLLVTGQGDIFARSGNLLYAVSDGGDIVLDGFELGAAGDEASPGSGESSMALGANRTVYVTSSGNIFAVGTRNTTCAISGTISGDVVDTVFVYLRGAEMRETVTGADGTFSFAGLNQGNYLVTAYRQGVSFDPPGHEITIESADVADIDFIASADAPGIGTALADPTQVPNDAATPITFTAEVDPGIGSLSSVAIDLTPIGGSSAQQMQDNGDGTYSYTTVVPTDTSVGLKIIEIAATDNFGESARKVLTVDVVNWILGTILNKEYRVFVEAGDLLKITYWLPDVTSLQDDLVLQIFKPSNTSGAPDFEKTFSPEKSSFSVESPETGFWTYKVVSAAPAAMARSTRAGGSYAVNTSTAGSGVLFGVVRDAGSGMFLANSQVFTNSGGSTKTDEGYYVLLNPAGLATVTARATEYKPESNSVSISSGGSIESNMALEPGDFDNGTTIVPECVLASVFKQDIGTVALLRWFRDTRLAKSASGTSYTKQYYQFLPELKSIIKGNPLLEQEIRETVQMLLPAVIRALFGQQVVLSDAQKNQMIGCMKAIQQHGSERIGKELSGVITSVQQNRMLQDLGL